MGKIAYVFPGQGVQYSGMGKDIYDEYESSRKIYELASKATGIDVEQLCFSENEKLDQTEYTQIAILTTEVAIMQAVNELGIKPDVCAGLSLGEYAALATSKVLDYSDLFKLIRKRGLFMQNAYPTGGAMTAVSGLDSEVIKEACSKASGYCDIANYNCPGQIVITGEEQAVSEAAEKLKELGAKRCIPLNVSGPFHSRLLENAGEQLAKEMEHMEFSNPCIPYISNVNADYVTDKDKIPTILANQVSKSVMWHQSIERMIADGVDTFIEIGPGRTLSGFIRKINKEVTVYNVDSISGLEKLKASI